jgi:Flp pilus assembly pilin Flp
MAYAISAYAVSAITSAVARLRRREEGQGFVEYVVLIALIALAMFLAITFFSKELGSVFSAIASTVREKLPPS